MHIRNLTICLDIYSASTLWVIDSCHVALKFCHLPLRHIFFPKTLSCRNQDSCGLLSAWIYQLNDQSVSLSRWEVGCIKRALRRTVDTVTFKKTKDLRNIIRHAGHGKSKPSIASEMTWHSQLRWQEVILYVSTQPVTDILSFETYYIWYILKGNEQSLLSQVNRGSFYTGYRCKMQDVL